MSDGLFTPDGKTHAPGCAVHSPPTGSGCDCYLSLSKEELQRILDLVAKRVGG